MKSTITYYIKSIMALEEAMQKNKMSAHSFQIKERYFIEPGFGISGWVMRKEGSGSVVKKAKHRNLLLYFAEKRYFTKMRSLGSATATE